MFDLEAGSAQFSLENSVQNAIQSISSIKDTISSLTYRISTLENNVNTKIERNQCMEILQKKVNNWQIRKMVDEISNKLVEDKKKQEENFRKIRKQQTEGIKRLMKRLKKQEKSKPIQIIKPQQLFLESNETMFGLIIDQIAHIKELYHSQESKIQHKNKTSIRLNNEVCEKLQNLQREMQHKLKAAEYSQKKAFESTWTVSEKKNRKISGQRNQCGSQSFDSIRMDIVGKSMENLQKELSLKLSIKDLLPLIKKNIAPLTQQIRQMKTYLEESMESTKKILMHQSQINQQLCTGSKWGWWQSFEEKSQRAIWQKQIINLYPQGFTYVENQQRICINQQGVYVIKVYGIEDEVDCILIDEEEKQINRELIIRLQKGAVLTVPSNGDEILIFIHKI